MDYLVAIDFSNKLQKSVDYTQELVLPGDFASTAYADSENHMVCIFCSL